MNKQELITLIASNANLSKADAGRALDGFIDAVAQTLKKGDTVILVKCKVRFNLTGDKNGY
jgi:DNA-binding protein HU-beta